VLPLNLEDDELVEYYDLKKQYRQKIINLLAIRKGFTERIYQGQMPTYTTQNEDVEINEVEYSKYSAAEEHHSRK